MPALPRDKFELQGIKFTRRGRTMETPLESFSLKERFAIRLRGTQTQDHRLAAALENITDALLEILEELRRPK